jgi:hypothetical protein
MFELRRLPGSLIWSCHPHHIMQQGPTRGETLKVRFYSTLYASGRTESGQIPVIACRGAILNGKACPARLLFASQNPNTSHRYMQMQSILHAGDCMLGVFLGRSRLAFCRGLAIPVTSVLQWHENLYKYQRHLTAHLTINVLNIGKGRILSSSLSSH